MVIDPKQKVWVFNETHIQVNRTGSDLTLSGGKTSGNIMIPTYIHVIDYLSHRCHHDSSLGREGGLDYRVKYIIFPLSSFTFL